MFHKIIKPIPDMNWERGGGGGVHFMPSKCCFKGYQGTVEELRAVQELTDLKDSRTAGSSLSVSCF